MEYLFATEYELGEIRLLNNRYVPNVNSLSEDNIKDIYKQARYFSIVKQGLACFGFIIALVWRDAIREALNHYLERAGLMGSIVLYNFISALLVTVVVIAIMMGVSKYGRSRRVSKEI